MENDYIEVSTTFASEAEARQMAHLLVEQRLAACVQIIGPMTSVYRWQGTVEEEMEFGLVAKSRQNLFAQMEKLITAHHPYDLPQIIALPLLAVSRDYGEWLAAQLLEDGHD